MSHRFLTSMGVLAVAIAIASLLAVPVAGQAPASHPNAAAASGTPVRGVLGASPYLRDGPLRLACYTRRLQLGQRSSPVPPVRHKGPTATPDMNSEGDGVSVPLNRSRLEARHLATGSEGAVSIGGRESSHFALPSGQYRHGLRVRAS